MKVVPDGFKTGLKALIVYKTPFMREPLADFGVLHVEPSGEWWFPHWDDESCDLEDILEFKSLND